MKVSLLRLLFKFLQEFILILVKFWRGKHSIQTFKKQLFVKNCIMCVRSVVEKDKRSSKYQKDCFFT